MNLLDAGLLLLAAWVIFQAFRFVAAVRAYRLGRLDAAYRAASLVVTERRIVRAAKYRAQEREWGSRPEPASYLDDPYARGRAA